MGRRSMVAVVLAVVSFVVVPLSYSWVLSPGENQPWLGWVIAISEWGGLACAVVAIVLGRRARAAGDRGAAATWAPRIAIGTILVYLAMLVALIALYRD